MASGTAERKTFPGLAPLNCRSLRYGMTKGRIALPFRFDAADDEQQVPPLRCAPVGMTFIGIAGISSRNSGSLRTAFCVAQWRDMLSSLAVGQAQGLPAGIGGPTAVDHKGMPVDKAALLRIGQEKDGLGD